jgi:probable F420-dependent oxidoreductase
MSASERVGRVGIWSSLWTAAAEVEELGYDAIWLGSSPAVEDAGPVLDATRRITVATGIINIWRYHAETVAAQRAELEKRHPGRFLLGLGVSHPEGNADYVQPYETMQRYIDELDAATEPVPVADRVLAALGPKMLGLARDRSAGAHPYLVTVEQVAEERAILGPGSLLAPEYTVVVDDDLDRARSTARGMLGRYLRMRNYVNSFTRAGFTEDDFRDGGSDRLIDAVFAVGGPAVVGAKVQALYEAGADHVAIQALAASPDEQVDAWRRLRPYV